MFLVDASSSSSSGGGGGGGGSSKQPTFPVVPTLFKYLLPCVGVFEIFTPFDYKIVSDKI